MGAGKSVGMLGRVKVQKKLQINEGKECDM